MKPRTVTLALLPVGLVGIVACSSISADQACSDLATAVCNKIEQCAAIAISSAYGDTATCTARMKLSCDQSLALGPPTTSPTKTSDTPSSVEACAQAYATLSCGDALQNNPPKACQHTPGPLTQGSPCGTAGECSSGVCLAGTNGCGSCGNAAASGAACKTTTDCAAGLVCAPDASNAMRCIAPAASNADCTNTPCQVGLVCSGPSGSKTCTAPLPANSACSTTGQPCDSAAGYYCNPVQTRCMAVQFAGDNQPCGYDKTTGQLTACAGAGRCTQPLGSGTCTPPAADNQPCDTTNGPFCTLPAICTNGLCTVTDPATCQ